MMDTKSEQRGRTAIVTGAGSGIGRAIAVALANRGATVGCADISDGRDATAAAITERGGTAFAVELDVRSRSSWSAAVGATLALTGGLHVLANVAGVLAAGPDTAVDLSDDDWERVIGINLKGCWLGMQAVVPTMRAAGGGHIVSIASLAAHKGQRNLLAYSTSKGGVIAMTQQAAVEYAGDQIFVNAIAPGVVDTAILGDMSDEMRSSYADAHLIKRLGQPGEIAELFCYLARPTTTFVTGQVFRIDGGASVL